MHEYQIPTKLGCSALGIGIINLRIGYWLDPTNITPRDGALSDMASGQRKSLNAPNVTNCSEMKLGQVNIGLARSPLEFVFRSCVVSSTARGAPWTIHKCRQNCGLHVPLLPPTYTSLPIMISVVQSREKNLCTWFLALLSFSAWPCLAVA